MVQEKKFKVMELVKYLLYMYKFPVLKVCACFICINFRLCGNPDTCIMYSSLMPMTMLNFLCVCYVVC